MGIPFAKNLEMIQRADSATPASEHLQEVLMVLLCSSTCYLLLFLCSKGTYI